jgi:elongation factor Tu
MSEVPEDARILKFLMVIDDVFSITGRGLVAGGRTEYGVINVGDEVEIIGAGRPKIKTVIKDIQKIYKLMDPPIPTDGLCLSVDIKREDMEGRVMIAWREAGE